MMGFLLKGMKNIYREKKKCTRQKGWDFSYTLSKKNKSDPLQPIHFFLYIYADDSFVAYTYYIK